MSTKSTPARRRRDAALLLILLFWIAFYLIVTAVDHLVAGTAILFLPRALISLSGLGLSLLLASLRRFVAPGADRWRIGLMPLLAVIGAALQVDFNAMIFVHFAPDMPPIATATAYFAALVHWFWTYAAEFGIVLAIDHGRAVAARERRIAALGRLAHQAELRALRYQLDPHFLFNTLNSIAALVGRGDTEVAEGMIEDLSDFLHTTLMIAPHADVTLAEELELQRRYLAIETQRFPDRLRIEMDVQSEVMGAMIPGLITQPLTENVIRHAVAASDNVVTLTIRGRSVGGELELSVTNTAGRAARARRPGSGVGLANVSERLKVRFRQHHSFVAQPRPDGGFAATLRIPYRRSA